MLDPAKFVQDMYQRAYGITQGHVWPGITHCHLNLLSLRWLVAMNGALGATRLGSTVGTFFQALFRVLKKGVTAVTKIVIIRNMMA